MRKLESTGVARSIEVVHLASSTAALGRKCDSTTCLVRRGVGRTAFKRCGGCKQAWYCSAHCQVTHWRSGHSAACKQLAQAVKCEQEQPSAPAVTERCLLKDSTNSSCATAVKAEEKEEEEDSRLYELD